MSALAPSSLPQDAESAHRSCGFSWVPARTWCWLLAWCILALAGLGYLATYANTAAGAAQLAVAWPPETTLPREPHGSTLVMFIHPRCPCTRSSLAELDRLLPHLDPAPQVLAVFIRPAPYEDGWEQTALWTAAQRMASVRPVADPGGVQARLFGARTSGEIGLYDREGALRFAGGITSSRAHEGPSLGAVAVRAWVNAGFHDLMRAEVFGCALFDGPAAVQASREAECCPR